MPGWIGWHFKEDWAFVIYCADFVVSVAMPGYNWGNSTFICHLGMQTRAKTKNKIRCKVAYGLKKREWKQGRCLAHSVKQQPENWQIYDCNPLCSDYSHIFDGFHTVIYFMWQSELNISLVFILFSSHKQPYILFHCLINVFALVIIIINFKIFSNIIIFRWHSSAFCVQIPIKFISIGSYFPEVHAFGTLIMSTKVFRLIIQDTSKIISRATVRL